MVRLSIAMRLLLVSQSTERRMSKWIRQYIKIRRLYIAKEEVVSKGKGKNKGKPVDIGLKLIIPQEQAKNNIASDKINHLMDSLKAKDSVEVNAKKDSVQRSLIQFNADNQNSKE